MDKEYKTNMNFVGGRSMWSCLYNLENQLLREPTIFVNVKWGRHKVGETTCCILSIEDMWVRKVYHQQKEVTTTHNSNW